MAQLPLLEQAPLRQAIWTEMYQMYEHDEICLCFHVTRRKLIKFVRIEQPQRESQMSECNGAGTGCGWCRPYLKEIFQAESGVDTDPQRVESITSEEYALLRQRYRSEQDRGEKGDPTG